MLRARDRSSVSRPRWTHIARTPACLPEQLLCSAEGASPAARSAAAAGSYDGAFAPQRSGFDAETDLREHAANRGDVERLAEMRPAHHRDFLRIEVESLRGAGRDDGGRDERFGSRSQEDGAFHVARGERDDAARIGETCGHGVPRLDDRAARDRDDHPGAGPCTICTNDAGRTYFANAARISDGRQLRVDDRPAMALVERKPGLRETRQARGDGVLARFRQGQLAQQDRLRLMQLRRRDVDLLHRGEIARDQAPCFRDVRRIASVGDDVGRARLARTQIDVDRVHESRDLAQVVIQARRVKAAAST